MKSDLHYVRILAQLIDGKALQISFGPLALPENISVLSTRLRKNLYYQSRSLINRILAYHNNISLEPARLSTPVQKSASQFLYGVFAQTLIKEKSGVKYIL